MNNFNDKQKSILNIFSLKRKRENIRENIKELIRNYDLEKVVSEDILQVSRQERALLLNVLDLHEIKANDVMIPRTDIIALPDDLSLKDTLQRLKKDQHSRLPVYHKELDNIIGMLHVKDILFSLDDRKEFNLKRILRQPLFIAPTIPILDLLLQMRQYCTHMALVIDEYGSIDGLVTIEDLIEKIVGDISDEHDEPVKKEWVERSDGSIDIDARLSVKALEERIGHFLTEEEIEAEIETVGGLVFRMAEHVPVKNEIITHPSGIEFMVIDSDARHIRKIRMKIPPSYVNNLKKN